MVVVMLVVAVVFLAYSNGANDNFKGVATLFGSGTACYGTALIWATVTTLAGSLLALVLAQGLVDSFRGKGLVPDAVTVETRFLLSVSLGAAFTVLLATRIGMPISTTHALTGSLVGAGMLAASGDVRFAALGKQFILPLLFAPVASLLLAVLLYNVFSRTRRWSGISSQTCVCLEGMQHEVRINSDGTMSLTRTGLVVEMAGVTECRTRYQGRMIGIEAGPILDGLHYLSAGAVGFARGLNDTPKMVALLIAASAVAPSLGLSLIAVAMALGGILGARRVAETMSRKITLMNPGQGVTANLITSFMVTIASRFGLPVSTTHVSVGSLFGIGLVNGTARRKTILSILVAWVTTLPTAAVLAFLIYAILGLIPLA
ncbi:MAG: inorganic phosphate transporter family protein [Planctomycetes bacterium]|nr:inorganic phosphate transporter family protein [Planctomycetota bacterium]